MKEVSQVRRNGNADESKKMIGMMMKLVGNAAFGRSGMDMTKHNEVEFLSEEKSIYKATEDFTSSSKTELNGGTVELVKNKCSIKLKTPIHLAIAIYQLANLRMLQFYYDCIDFYFDRSDFQYQEMDTDSAYIAFSADNPFPDLIKPELRGHFQQHQYEWFPRDYNSEVLVYDTFTPGLLKEEWRGDDIISLSSKNYICYLPDEKYKIKTNKRIVNGEVRYFKLPTKGIQKSRKAGVLTPENFEAVVKDKISIQGNNKGFHISKETNSIITYNQTKTALNYYYDKRRPVGWYFDNST